MASAIAVPSQDTLFSLLFVELFAEHREDWKSTMVLPSIVPFVQ